jgi:hypothetical protein
MSKYKAVPTFVDGIRFASKLEANRYAELKILVRAGQIRNLVLQPKFDLVVMGHKICRFVGDFSYIENGQTTVEDAKGVPTEAFKIKWKLVQALFPHLIFRLVTK